jgi:MFS family permease
LIPIVYALFNLVSALAAIPAGHLADRVGRRRVIAYGWGVYSLAYLGFALVKTPWLMWVCFAFYGLYYALTEGSAKALVAELVPESNRGAAYGLFNASIGIMALPASLIAGALWSAISPAAPFAFGAALAGLAFLGLRLLPQGQPAR